MSNSLSKLDLEKYSSINIVYSIDDVVYGPKFIDYFIKRIKFPYTGKLNKLINSESQFIVLSYELSQSKKMLEPIEDLKFIDLENSNVIEQISSFLSNGLSTFLIFITGKIEKEGGSILSRIDPLKIKRILDLDKKFNNLKTSIFIEQNPLEAFSHPPSSNNVSSLSGLSIAVKPTSEVLVTKNRHGSTYVRFPCLFKDDEYIDEGFSNDN